MYKLELEVNALPKSLNKKLQWGGKFTNLGENKRWDATIAIMTRGKLPAQPLAKARIRLVRHFWRTLDYDGLVGSMKPVVDALVDAGVLVDDSWKVLGQWEVDQVFRPKKYGPLLEIEVTEA